MAPIQVYPARTDITLQDSQRGMQTAANSLDRTHRACVAKKKSSLLAKNEDMLIAAACGHTKTMATLLQKRGLNVNALGQPGNVSALGIAAAVGNTDMTRLLLVSKADVNHKDDMNAIMEGRDQAVGVLLDFKADARAGRVRLPWRWPRTVATAVWWSDWWLPAPPSTWRRYQKDSLP